MRSEVWKEVLRQHGCLSNGQIKAKEGYPRVTFSMKWGAYFSVDLQEREKIKDRGEFFTLLKSSYPTSSLEYHLWDDVESISFDMK